MKKKTVGQIVLLIVLAVLALVCLLPMLLVLAASFSSDHSLQVKGFSFVPLEWSTEGWEYVLSMGSQLMLSYRNTICITIVGTAVSLFFMSMLAYALSHRNFVFRKAISFLLLGTMLFSGGQLSHYMVNTTIYHLKDNMLILFLPSISAMHVIILRTYIQGNIAEALVESAKIDGAGEFRIYAQVVMPLLLPVMASVGFMVAIGYWNNWETGYLYIKTQSKLPLQTLLMQIEKRIEMLNNPNMNNAVAAQMWETVPEISARMAMLVTVIGPIMIAYPFFQKYYGFATGMQAAQQEGRNYFVPIYKEAAVGHGFVYSIEKAEENGWDFSDVKTYADLTPFLQDAYEKGATNAWLPVSNSWMAFIEDTYAMLSVCGTQGIVGIRIDEGTTVENLIESDLYKEHVSLMYEWNQAGYINPERAVSTNFPFEDIGRLMLEGDVLCAMWTTVPDNIANASLRYGIPVGTILESKNYLSNEGTFGSSYMVNARTEKADACLKLLELLSTDQTLADLLCYGIEGKHYTRDAEGYVTVNTDAGWKNSVWSCCNVMAPSLQKGESADKKEQYDAFNKNAETSILAHFVFDDSKVAAECSAVNAVCGEYFRLLDTGFYNPDEYLPKFQKALKDAGIDKILEEAQAQYDAYRS